MDTNSRIQDLRNEMKTSGIDAYIIPSGDPHQSEYVADHFKDREWISGFNGSAGTVVVFHDHAGMWTDSRYFIQAEAQFKDSEFELHKIIDRANPGMIEFIIDNLTPGAVVGCNGNVFALAEIKELKEKFNGKGIKLITDKNLTEKIWYDRPSLPKNKIADHSPEYAGKTRLEKMEEVRSLMKNLNVEEYLIPALDSIAWLLNLRGNDIDFNPVFYSFGILRENDFLLFVDKEKVNYDLKVDLDESGIILLDYSEIYNYLSDSGKSIYTDPSYCNFNLYNSISGKITEGEDLINNIKTIKNSVEIENLKQAHRQDGVSLVKFYIWLENELKNRPVSEFEAAEKIAHFRSIHPEYRSESFEPIVGFKENGAIIHYSPTSENSSLIQGEGMLLIDSGGQYLNGTTDITRTTYIGDPTAEQIRLYTAVLKGHLAVKNMKFPVGIIGFQIDVLARQFLWANGVSFYHGTGHGVGFYLNVHEGPQGITNFLAPRAKIAIKEGMLTSNEPGYYKEGEYGIRIENLILAVEAFETEHGKFLTHEDITLFPYEKKLIDFKALTQFDVMLINEYHQKVYGSLSAFLNEEEKSWLEEKCRKI
ncbi:MAG: aminopeptidase P family protein [Deltaproteobacteria bacterium]